MAEPSYATGSSAPAPSGSAEIAPATTPIETAPKTETISTGRLSGADLIAFLQECIRSGEAYRDTFRPIWEEVEKQIRCEQPPEWAQKEKWQTKIFIPLQAKKEETAVSYLKKMVFGKGQFFDIVGQEKDDVDDGQNLTKLSRIILDLGDFDAQNDFVVTEAVGSPGSSFIKVTQRLSDGYFNFTWRSPYNVLIDPEAGQCLYKARFIIDVYKKDIAYLIRQTKKGGLYEHAAKEIDAFLNFAAEEAKTTLAEAAKASSSNNSGASREPMIIVKGIDGTNDITIPARYRQLDLHEFSVQVPRDDGTYEFRTITMVNKSHVIRDDENVFGCHNWVGARTKPRKYDWYGRGYLENGRGFQDLSNSMVCLGFDSAKISAMDIIMLDETKVKESASIEYKPLAVWKLKGDPRAAVDIRRQPVSAITDVVKGLQLIDVLDQDASGITRAAQGQGGLPGQAGDSTLGEYQLKMQLIDQRFLDQGRFLEHDYIEPLISLIFKIVTNEKLFSQEKADRLLGVNEVDVIEQVPDLENPGTSVSKVTGKTRIPKLDVRKLRAKGEMSFDYKAVGITQFTGRLEQLNKIGEGIKFILEDQTGTLRTLMKLDVLVRKYWQLSEIDDYQDFMRSADEIKKMMGMGGQQGQAGGG